jgi:hypothetical protein
MGSGADRLSFAALATWIITKDWRRLRHAHAAPAVSRQRSAVSGQRFCAPRQARSLERRGLDRVELLLNARGRAEAER